MRRQLSAIATLAALAAVVVPGVAQAADLTDASIRPAEVVTATSTEAAPDCAANRVATTWTQTTVSWTWDAAQGRWTEAAPVVETSTSYRPLTTAEQAACGTTAPEGMTGDAVAAPDADVAVAPAAVETTYTAQVNTYSWKNSAWFGNRIASFDDDGVLRYREDGFLWMSPAAKAYTSYAHSVVTFQAPAGATQAELVAAYNAAAPAAQRITTTAKAWHVARTGSVTDVWVLGEGATASAPWGAAKTVHPTFLGRH